MIKNKLHFKHCITTERTTSKHCTHWHKVHTNWRNTEAGWRSPKIAYLYKEFYLETRNKNSFVQDFGWNELPLNYFPLARKWNLLSFYTNRVWIKYVFLETTNDFTQLTIFGKPLQRAIVFENNTNEFLALKKITTLFFFSKYWTKIRGKQRTVVWYVIDGPLLRVYFFCDEILKNGNKIKTQQPPTIL